MVNYTNFADYTLDQITRYLQDAVNTRYNAEDITKINEALKIAQDAHKDQVRIDNLPFILHPMRVALMLLQLDRNVTSRIFIAALLHDVLEEDTCVTKAVIEEKFGRYTTRLVQSVTRSCKNLMIDKRNYKRSKEIGKRLSVATMKSERLKLLKI